MGELHYTHQANNHREEHVYLVAFTVESYNDRETGERYLMSELRGLLDEQPRVGEFIQEWWIAEDDRHDGSDNDSAVFVPMGTQRLVYAAVQADA